MTPEAARCCAGCSVRIECLTFALADTDIAGTWAGTTAKQRSAARRAGKSAADVLAALDARAA